MNKLEKAIYGVIGEEAQDKWLELLDKDGKSVGRIILSGWQGSKKELMEAIDTRKEEDGTWSIWIGSETVMACYYGVVSFEEGSY